MKYLILFGALLGGLSTSYLAPKVISWYFDPPTPMGISCILSIEWALNKFQWAQGLGILSGAVLGFVLYRLLYKRSNE